jgi:hypothetical protein
LGTALATIVTVMVNGAAISQAILRPRNGSGKENAKEEEEQTKYTLDIYTQDQDKEQRTVLVADDLDVLWIYAKVVCNKKNVDTKTLTKSISFAKEGQSSDWLVLGQAKFVDDSKVVAVKARPPFEDAELASDQATVSVSVNIEGNLIRGPVDLTLYAFKLVIT